MNELDNNPLVSAVIPSYNHSQYIEQTIQSIVSQTYKNIEIIIIDDGSSDGSSALLDDLQKKYKFILYKQKNIGLPSTLNKAITEYVNGKYLSVCASDDYWHKEKIERLVHFMEKNKFFPICYCKTIFVDEYNNEIKNATNSANKNLRGGYIFKEIICQKIHFLPGIVRLNAYSEVGYYDPSIWTEDFDFNLRIAQKYCIGFINEYLNFYRYPSYQSKKLITRKVPNSHKICIDKYASSRYYSNAVREWHFRNFVWFSKIRNQKIFALKSMFLSISYSYRLSYFKAFVSLIFEWRS